MSQHFCTLNIEKWNDFTLVKWIYFSIYDYLDF